MRTACHFGGGEWETAVQAIQRAAPEQDQLAVRVLAGRYTVSDVAGILAGPLPEDITEIQHFHVEHAYALSQEALFRRHVPAGTTTSTTGMFLHPYGVTGVGETVTIYRVVVMAPGHLAYRDVRQPCAQLDVILDDLAQDVHYAGRAGYGLISPVIITYRYVFS